MYNCNECSERLLDYLYDLLEESEAKNLRAHLEDCSLCRAEMALAEEDQQLLAKAACVYDSVPKFAPPPTQITSLPACPAVGDAETIVQFDTVENEPNAPVHKPLRARLRPWLAAAAVLLVGAGLIYGWYHQGLVRREQAFDLARRNVNHIDTQLASLGEELEKSRVNLVGTSENRGIVIRAYGAAHYQPKVENSIRVVTSNLENKSAEAEITARCYFQANKKPVTIKTNTANGQTRIGLPGNLPVNAGEKLRLEIVAKSGGVSERIEETLTVAKPSFVTHIYTTKPAYNVGELLFFRTVTLDRFTLQPANRRFQLMYSLLNGEGKQVLQVPGLSGDGGIGGGEFALTDTNSLPDGEYTLRVDQLGSSKDYEFRPQDRSVVIRRAEAPEVVLNQSNFAPGDVIRGNITSRRSRNGVARSQEPVTVKFRWRGGRAGAQSAKGAKELSTQQLRTDNTGNAQFEVPLDKSLPPGIGELEFQFHDGVRDEKVTQVVPVTPNWKAEFFPEGGRLTANVSNNLFCRVTAPTVPANKLQAQLVNTRTDFAKPVPLKKVGNSFIGNVEFTPAPGDQYKLRVPAAGKKTLEEALPTAQSDGAALTVANAVAAENTPIDCQVSSKPGNQQLLVVAVCRGRVIDQQLVGAVRSGTKVRLHAGANVCGIVRVTVYEPKATHLKPLAERLVYRQPSGKLRLSYSPQPNGKRRYLPGERVDLLIRAENESSKAAEPWVAANVVADDAYDQRVEFADNMPFFFLGGQFAAPEDFEDAQVVLRDEPDAAEKLERFLAADLGRRFVPINDADPDDAKVGDKSQPAKAPLLFSRDNRLQLQDRNENELNRQVASLEEKSQQRNRQLREEREERVTEAKTAFTALSDFREMPLRVGRLAIGVLCLALLAGGAVMLFLGFVRIIRGSRAARPVLAVAFASLLLCLMLYGAFTHLQPLLQPQLENAATMAIFSPDSAPEPPHLKRILLAENRKTARVNSLPSTAAASRLQKPKGKLSRPDLAKIVQESKDRNQSTITNTAIYSNFANYRRRQDPLAQQMTILHLQGMQQRPRFAEVDNLQKQIKKAQLMASIERFWSKNPGSPSQTGGGATAPNPKGGAKNGQGGSKPAGNIPATPNFPGGIPPIKQQPLPGAQPIPPFGVPAQGPDPKPGMGGKSGGSKGIGQGGGGFNQFGQQTNMYYARDFFNQNLMDGSLSRDTLLWKPALFLKNGKGQVSFDLPYQANTFRIFIQGHDAAGRFGYQEGRIEVRKK